eukprot:jgi/Mesvir1/20945/Mv08016-RA.1
MGEVAILGGGCFWCVEGALNEIAGVNSVISGYSGGDKPDPTYEEVCSETTGHAEVVQVTFDPSVISFRDLLMVFFVLHDPTQLDRQGHDIGRRYRSVIFYTSEDQHRVALDVISDLTAQKLWPDKIVTQVLPAKQFYPAEEYHQEYFKNNPNQPYCRAVVAGKVSKVRKEFFNRLKKK